MRLAIVTTHPIQYNAPWFKLLAKQHGIEIKVFYTWEQSATPAKYDPGFGKVIEWDLPRLDGYEYNFVKNVSKKPGSHHFYGIDTPSLIPDIVSWGAQAVLIFGWPFKGHLACMKYFKGRMPVLFRGDSTLLDEKPGIKQLIRRIFLRYIYSFIDYALYTGTHNKNYFLAHGVKNDELIFAPHAVDNKRFSEHSSDHKQEAIARKRDLGIPDNAFVVLFAGKFNDKKDPFFLLQLAEHLPGEQVCFILVGNGQLKKELVEKTTDRRIFFMDFQNQSKMPVVYNMCDVFLLPSKGPGETWGLAVNEAMAAGKYIITTTMTGCSADLVINGQNGIVIEPGDVESAAAYIRQLLKSSSTDTMKETNAILLEKYSYENIVKNIVGLLNLLKTKIGK